MKDSLITIETSVKAPVSEVWKYWTQPEHITRWCYASDDWHAPKAENDLKVNGKFKTRMAAKDGSSQFDFEGKYTKVDNLREICYTIPDGRKVIVKFSGAGNKTKVTESFEPEKVNPPEMQREGWKAILENFRKYSETKH